MGQHGREVESLVTDPAFWRNRRVLLTGHTGFKGGWMALVLASLGSKVYGYSLPPENALGIYSAVGVASGLHEQVGDVRDFAALKRAVEDARPSVIVHMAAQSLVRRSYSDPVDTYSTNVMGTVNLLEAVRLTKGADALVVVTSDKCYDNVKGKARVFNESDRLGGHDPYSNSKGCAELVTDAYRRSFFQSRSAARIASVRAGNVIGGGDWAVDRLVPDAMRAFSSATPLRIRNPAAVRPWQHVLDPVFAYLTLAQRLVSDGGEKFSEGWNFGPASDSEVPVGIIVSHLVRLWGSDARWEQDRADHPHEAGYLALDCSKAAAKLGWTPRFALEEALALTVDWYRAQQDGADMRAFTLRQIERQLNDVR